MKSCYITVCNDSWYFTIGPRELSATHDLFAPPFYAGARPKPCHYPGHVACSPNFQQVRDCPMLFSWFSHCFPIVFSIVSQIFWWFLWSIFHGIFPYFPTMWGPGACLRVQLSLLWVGPHGVGITSGSRKGCYEPVEHWDELSHNK